MMERIGKYQIVELIGRGGMGSVYKARDTILDRLVALKVISPEVEVTEDITARFFDEAKACAVLSHPSIVTIYDVGEDSGRLYIVMELLDGLALKAMIAERTALSIQEKISVMIRLCDALSYAHQKGVIHRDIKPANILFQRVGPPKIIDFGIAKMATSTSLTRTGLIMGTLRYMPPEQVRGRADQSSDQYSIAAVFYELLSLRAPFEGDDPIQLLEMLRAEQPPRLVDLNPAIPAELAAVIERGMAKKSEDRYPDMQAMRTDLEAIERKLAEEAHKIQQELGPLVGEMRSLDEALAKRLGGPTGLTLPTVPDGPWIVEVLRERLNEARTTIETLRDRMRTLEESEPRLRKAVEAAGAGRHAEARGALEGVLAALPDYAVARAALEDVREGEESARRIERARALIDDAQKALEAEDAEACLALLRDAAGVPAPPESASDIAALTNLAKELIGKQAAKRRVQQQAEQARETMRQASEEAATAAAAQSAPEAWATAGSKSKEAESLFADAKYSEASSAYEDASEAYRAATKHARDIADQRRREAEAAELVERTTRTRGLLDRARQSVSENDYPRSLEILKEIEKLPPPPSELAGFTELLQQVETTINNERRSRKPAQQARMVMIRARGDAEKQGAAKAASTIWAEAEAKAAAGTVAFQRESFSDAHDAFVAATSIYQRSIDAVRAAKAGDVSAKDAPAPGSHAEAPGHEPDGKSDRKGERARDDETKTAFHVAPAPRVPVKGKEDLPDGDDDRTLYSSRLPERSPGAGVAPASGAGGAARRPPTDESDITLFQAAPQRTGGPGNDGERKEPKDPRAKADPAAEQRHAAPWELRHLAMAGGAAAVLVIAGLLVSRSGQAPVESTTTVASAPATATTPPASPPAASAPPVAAATPPAAAPPVATAPPAVATQVPKQSPTTAPSPPADATGDEATRARFAAAEAMQKEAREASEAGDYARAEQLYAGAREAFDAIAKPAAAGPGAQQAASAEATAREEADAKAAAKLKADAEAKAKVEADAKAKAEADARAKAEAEAKALAQAKAETEAREKAEAKAAAQAKAEVEARETAEAKAAAKAKAEAEAKAQSEAKAAAKAKADLQAKKEAEAKASAKAKKEAEEKALAKAGVPAAPTPEPGATKTVLALSHAYIFTEPTDGKRGGGAWGACWRVDPAAARSCARASCDKTRNSSNACVETASSAKGGHCAVARASGFGVSFGACGNSSSEATSAALSGCAQQVRRTYGESIKCSVAWSTDRP